MNILFIAAFPILPNEGGVQRVTYTLATEFEKLGIEVRFLSIRPENKFESKIDHRQLFLKSNENQLFERQKHLSKIIKEYSIDIVINQAGIYKEVMQLLNVVRPIGTKLITVHHNCVTCLNERYREIILSNKTDSYLWQLLDRPWVWKVLRYYNRKKYGGFFKNAIRDSTYLVLLSSTFIPELKFYGVSDKDISQVVGIQNPAPFKVQPEALLSKENRIVFVGRLEKAQKRVDRLMKIWHQLHTVFPNWYFDVVGDGGEREWMEDYCKQNQLNRVLFHGLTDPKPYLEKAKFFTMTSDFEGFGMVLVEAQAYGVVPIAFDCFPALKDIIINNQSGLIIANFDNNQYVKKIADLMRDDFKRNAIAIQAQNSLMNFNPSVVAKKWLPLFN